MKTCAKCGAAGGSEVFYRDRSSSDGLTSQCRECLKAARKVWYRKNTERAVADSRERRTGSREPVVGACDICTEEGTLVVDHDHRCCPPNRSCAKCRRGHLCHHCNKMLGMAKDDPGRLLAGARFLQAWEERRAA